ITVDATAAGTPLSRSWELAIGSGDAWSLLRADLQAQLRRAVAECGFRYLRCHGILCDQLQAVRRTRQGELVYNWQLVDDVQDALLELGLRPFVELAFMPSALASGDRTVFHYRANVTPPRSYDEWNDLIRALVAHWLDRYGADEVHRWYFEVWNEANLSSFWTGTRDDYFRLYAETARTLKALDPALRVGGPASCRAEWLPEFIGWCRERGVPFDFISPHVYPDDDEFERVDPSYREVFNRGDYLETVVERATESVAALAPGHEMHWTEWNSSWRWGRPIHDETNQAAYICRAIHRTQHLVDSFAYWTVSDIFNEFPYPRGALVGGFGLFAIDGLPKPAYHAYTLLHRLGDVELPAAVSEVDHVGQRLDCWATRSGAGWQVLLANYTPPGQASPATLTAEVALREVGAVTPLRVTEYRIDDHHANLRGAWEAMGSPETPTRAQVDALAAAAALRPAEWDAVADGSGTATLRVALPPGSTVLLDVVAG
ncbi:MAG TPA: hypothetical protein VMU89_02340, partial [Thermomicrobiaceae bacterium]|nr:hypothetical protein [Thermomicrobiaceae bacterium]